MTLAIPIELCERGKEQSARMQGYKELLLRTEGTGDVSVDSSLGKIEREIKSGNVKGAGVAYTSFDVSIFAIGIAGGLGEERH